MGHTQTARLSVAIGADGDLQMAAFDLGGGLVRNDVDIDLNAPRANVEFNGLYLAAEGQHIDNHTRVDHRVERVSVNCDACSLAVLMPLGSTKISTAQTNY